MNEKNTTHNIMINEICLLIQKNPKITLTELASIFGMNSTYLQKLFSKLIGVSPKQYAVSVKQNNFKDLLTQDISITQAIYQSGHESNSRVYEKSNELLGMTPKQYKSGHYTKDIMLAIGECYLGSFLVAQTDKGICDVSLGNNPEKLIYEIQDRFKYANFIAGDKSFEDTVAKVVGLIENPKNNIDLPLDIIGTLFQQKVWQVLKNIPVGTTVSYQQLAEMVGSPKAVRAVASACARNNIAILIPCHRVVRTNGNLGGYRWGIEVKKQLLQQEKNNIHD